MDEYLYKDLYDLEETHWWHIAKRAFTVSLIQKFAPNKTRIRERSFACAQDDNTGLLKIVDIGCGTGKNVEVFKALGESWGLDMSKDALAFCKKRGLTTVSLGTAEKTNFKDASFDVVTLLDVLEHTDDGKTLMEMHRIVKPGGIVLISVPAYAFMWSKWDEVLHHKRRYTKQSLITVLKKAHFSVSHITYTQSFLLLPVFITRLIKERLYKGKTYESDFRTSFFGMHIVLSIVSAFERFFALQWGIPFGLSVVAVAKKVR